MIGHASCAKAYAARVLIASRASRRLRLSSSKAMPPSVNPALCTTASMRSNAFTVARTAPRAPCSVLRSPRYASACPPVAWIAATTSCAGLSSAPVPNNSVPASLTTTCAPLAASNDAWLRPMPLPAPVTSTTRSSNRSSPMDRLLGEATVLTHVAAQAAGHCVARCCTPMLSHMTMSPERHWCT